jgi:hypothetical protein
MLLWQCKSEMKTNEELQYIYERNNFYLRRGKALRDTHFQDEAITPWTPNFVNALIWGASFGVKKSIG